VSRRRADRVAAWATGAGVGLLTLMVTGLVGNRLAELIWDAPVAPVVALVTAVLAGVLTAVIVGTRLVRSVP
jgi:hypothetical protein